MDASDWMELVARLDNAGCLSVLAITVIYITRWSMPIIMRVLESHDKRVEQLIALLQRRD